MEPVRINATLGLLMAAGLALLPTMVRGESGLVPGGYADHWLQGNPAFRGSGTLEQRAGINAVSDIQVTEGAFGALNPGQSPAAARGSLMVVPATVPVSSLSFRGFQPGHAASAAGTQGPNDRDVASVIWFSPRIDGVQLGLSYTAQESDPESPLGLFDQAQTNNRRLSVGASYLGSVKNVQILLTGTFVGEAQLGAVAPDQAEAEYSFGAQLGLAGFTVGGSVKAMDGGFALDGRAFDLGVGYATEQAAISLSYRGAVTGLGSAFGGSQDMVVLSSRYTLGPRVDWKASLFYADWPEDNGGDRRVDNGWAVITGIRFGF